MSTDNTNLRHDDDDNHEENKSGDQYREGWVSENWDIVGANKPDVSKRNHASGDPVGNGDKNEIKRDDDSGSSERGLGGTTQDNQGDNAATR